ncbi:MAG: hypothetical protein U5J78_04725 [Parasphingorhabdus sp.]|nr:hypothetical protein [Parasphingorhabdus sp.]
MTNLHLSARQATELRNAAALSAKQYRIRMLDDASPINRRLALALQSGFARMTPLKKQKMLDLLEKE